MNNLYIRLARTSIKNGRQFYLPYLLTGMLSAAMYYIMSAIQYNSGLDEMRGRSSLKVIITLGTMVVGIFVCIFLFYTNSFIIKRRKKELGIYNILGMEKRHIAKELAAEIFFTASVSITGGLVTGIMFNKLAVMLLYRFIGLSSPVQFEISPTAILHTVEVFGLIYLATLIYDVMQVSLSRPAELLHGGNAGEREPKTKTLMALAGIICTGTGYYIAITTKSPLKALDLFFIAVILVIIGTYSLFTAGSIAFLKALRKNRAFYYQTKHFISVSGMIYRMKQNAAGLASICILSTMVLVMVSATVCLYAGADDELKSRYPAEISVYDTYTKPTDHRDHSWLEKELEDIIRQNGRTVTSKRTYVSIDTMAQYLEHSHTMVFNPKDADARLAMIYFMTKKDYEQEAGVTLASLSAGELAVTGSPAYAAKELTLFDKTYTVKESVPFTKDSDENYMANMVGGMYYIILPDENAMDEMYTLLQKNSGEGTAYYKYRLKLDIDGSQEEKMACDEAVKARLQELQADDRTGRTQVITADYREMQRAGFYIQNGGFLFLGIFLGTMFLMVTVLIIFYKQISEGYEDRNRFAIMKKVGINNQDIRAAVSTQVRLVFILPVVTAAIHVTAAFPMISRLLMIMNLTNTKLFAVCLAGTVLVFSLIYLLVFWLTSGSYYKIVGSQTS